MYAVRILSWSMMVLSSSLFAPHAAAQPVAERPALKIGDSWQFRQSVKIVPGEETSQPWSRRIVEIQPDDRMVVAAGNNQSLTFDTSWNRIDPKGPEYSVVSYKFPMKVGDEWTYKARAGETGMLERQGKYKVAAFESVTVPAGTFDCFRIEGQWEISNRGYTGRAQEKYWYCPALRYVAKADYQFDQNFREQPSRSETRHSELTTH